MFQWMMVRARNAWWLGLLIVSAAGGGLPAWAADKRPQAPQLLPKETLAYFRVADTPELVERFQETAMGRILYDPQIAPLISQLYGEAASAFGQIENRVGASLDELLAMLQGELCIALVHPPNLPMAVVAVIDVGDSVGTAERMLENAEFEILQRGGVPDRTMVGETEINIFRTPGETRTEMAYFVRDQVLVIANNADVVKGVCRAWDHAIADPPEATDDTTGAKQPPPETLASNQKFTSAMKHCTGQAGERPQISFFIDPIEIVKSVSRDSVGGQAIVALLPPLGLNGIKGLGGSMIFATEEFDAIVHLHLLLVNPRTGALEILAMTSGDTQPQPWVPADAASYTTLHWDFEKSVAALRAVYDSVRGEGALSRDLEQNFSRRLGVDVEAEILPQMAGRVTHVTWMVKPARLNSQANLIGMKLNDAVAFEKTLNTIAANFGDRLAKEKYAGVSFWRITTRAEREGRQPRDPGPLLRRPEPSMVVLGDYFIFSGSTELLKEVIQTKHGNRKLLANELDYKLIASKIKRQPGGDAAAMISFSRPEQGLRTMYDLANADSTRETLATTGENNAVARILGQALKDNPLPPFEVLARYLAPSGGLMTSNESGIHYMAFQLKRK